MMNKWIEETLLPLVCAFGLGVVMTTHAADTATEMQVQEAAQRLAQTMQFSDCPPYGYPVNEPAPKIVAEAQP